VWELVKASDAGLLSITADVIEGWSQANALRGSSCDPAGASCSTGQGQCSSGLVSERADAALALFAALASHSCDPNTLRRLLGLAANSDASVLGAIYSAVCSAIARREASEAIPSAAPSRFFSFRGAGPLPLMPPLRGACFGRDAFSIWMWIRIDPGAGGTEDRPGTGHAPGAARGSGPHALAPHNRRELVLAFTAPDGHGIQIWIDEIPSGGGAPVAGGSTGGKARPGEPARASDGPGSVSRRLAVSVNSLKGGAGTARCPTPLLPGAWHFVAIEMRSPPRRSFWPFEASQPAAPPSMLAPEAYDLVVSSLHTASGDRATESSLSSLKHRGPKTKSWSAGGIPNPASLHHPAAAHTAAQHAAAPDVATGAVASHAQLNTASSSAADTPALTAIGPRSADTPPAPANGATASFHADPAATAATVVAAAASIVNAPRARPSGEGLGRLTVHVNAAPQLHIALPFPAPTRELCRWSVAGAAIPHATIGGTSSKVEPFLPVVRPHTFLDTVGGGEMPSPAVREPPSAGRVGGAELRSPAPSPEQAAGARLSAPVCGSLRAQLGEVVLVPCAAGGAAVAHAALRLRRLPGATLEECARVCGLLPSVVLRPEGMTMHGDSVRMPSFMSGGGGGGEGALTGGAEGGVRSGRGGGEGGGSGGGGPGGDGGGGGEGEVVSVGANAESHSHRAVHTDSLPPPGVLLGSHLEPTDALACVGGIRLILGMASAACAAAPVDPHKGRTYPPTAPLHSPTDPPAHPRTPPTAPSANLAAAGGGMAAAACAAPAAHYTTAAAHSTKASAHPPEGRAYPPTAPAHSPTAAHSTTSLPAHSSTTTAAQPTTAPQAGLAAPQAGLAAPRAGLAAPQAGLAGVGGTSTATTEPAARTAEAAAGEAAAATAPAANRQAAPCALASCVWLLRACIRRREKLSRDCLACRAVPVLALIVSRMPASQLSVDVVAQVRWEYYRGRVGGLAHARWAS
jgi:hypothetical protein